MEPTSRSPGFWASDRNMAMAEDERHLRINNGMLMVNQKVEKSVLFPWPVPAGWE